MNRLVIIGNGFDLAHGFKTSYNDFIVDCLKTAVLGADYFKPYRTAFVTAEFSGRVKFNKSYISEANTINEVLDFCRGNSIKLTYPFNWYKNVVEKGYIKGWTDFETEYYNQLILTYDFFRTHKSNFENRISKIKELNHYFNKLKQLLIDYLIKVSEGINSETTVRKFNSNFKSIFRAPIVFREILNKDKAYTDSDIVPNSIYFLSFNYTPTLDFYIDHWDLNTNIKVNRIHGNLNNSKNQVIFGYGDEFDKRYAEMEELNENIFLEHMKSFQYSQNSNYFELIKFLNSDKFQVFIVGHSCGLSDRVMLNRIFESENCLSIKLFYHERNETENDYNTKRIDISRHFKDKSKVNEIIVPFDASIPFKL